MRSQDIEVKPVSQLRVPMHYKLFYWCGTHTTHNHTHTQHTIKHTNTHNHTLNERHKCTRWNFVTSVVYTQIHLALPTKDRDWMVDLYKYKAKGFQDDWKYVNETKMYFYKILS